MVLTPPPALPVPSTLQPPGLPRGGPAVLFLPALPPPCVVLVRRGGPGCQLEIDAPWWRQASIPERRTTLLGLLREAPGAHFDKEVWHDDGRTPAMALVRALAIIPTSWWEQLIRVEVPHAR